MRKVPRRQKESLGLWSYLTNVSLQLAYLSHQHHNDIVVWNICVIRQEYKSLSVLLHEELCPKLMESILNIVDHYQESWKHIISFLCTSSYNSLLPCMQRTSTQNATNNCTVDILGTVPPSIDLLILLQYRHMRRHWRLCSFTKMQYHTVG